ncbi:NAD(P)-dependent dehydrogenase (short-subunit alcohol dehydrogenase family) [Pedobacter sp. AK017]|uniref:SDR family NAD(P)-dependent oxidoreductase n=1 Tax=Pedobacter sp. AK017 TaxID=2723073 RepID=UPI001607B6FB|nr:SDR family NAD(P)-dependent oxidoreductase [Pedobacter sp. AK017]MBB5440470.1 NAD(P)-dependent dehydrogenase (short-subunit alcohol dehydrogenase family) [Pedobacter sp. AK017]
MEQENKKTAKRKMSTRKKVLLILGIPLSLFIVLYAILIIMLIKNDPSSKDPLYTGEIIVNENQQPLKNQFGHGTGAMDVVKGMDLKGKVIVITGGHTGTGREATKAFVSAGATVIVLALDTDRAKKNLKGLPNVEIEYFDLLKPKTIDDFAWKFLKSNRQIDVLVNSAGVYNTPFQKDERGYEYQFATNVLGTYELTIKLLPALKKSNGARIVNLSSRGHRLNGVQFDDINFGHTPYDGMRSYAQTKSALSLLSIKEDELLQRYHIRAFAVHPGPIPTSDLFASSKVGFEPSYKIFFSDLEAKTLRKFWGTEILNYLRSPKNIGDIYKTVQQGAATTVWASISPELNGKGGLYLEDCNIAQVVPNGSKAPFGVRPWALERKAADSLWIICGKMTGVYLQFEQ